MLTDAVAELELMAALAFQAVMVNVYDVFELPVTPPEGMKPPVLVAVPPVTVHVASGAENGVAILNWVAPQNVGLGYAVQVNENWNFLPLLP